MNCRSVLVGTFLGLAATGLMVWACGSRLQHSYLESPTAILMPPPTSRHWQAIASQSREKWHEPEIWEVDAADLRSALKLRGHAREDADELVRLYVETRRIMLLASSMNEPKLALHGDFFAPEKIKPRTGDNFLRELQAACEAALTADWVKKLPEEFRLYMQGAAHFWLGKKEAAMEAWKQILRLPLPERFWRSSWAAWMLLRTESQDAVLSDEEWLDRIATLERVVVQEKCADSLRRWPATGLIEMRLLTDPTARLLAWSRALESGGDLAFRAIREAAAMEMSDAEFALTCQALFLSPAGRRALVHAVKLTPAHKLALYDALKKHGQRYWEISALAWQAQEDALWCDQWLELCAEEDPEAQWLRARRAVQRGDLLAARKKYAQLIAQLPSVSLAAYDIDAMDYRPAYHTAKNVSDLRTRLKWQEYGEILLACSESQAALTAFLYACSWRDAAYIAERVLTVHEFSDYLARPPAQISQVLREPSPPRAWEVMEEESPALSMRPMPYPQHVALPKPRQAGFQPPADLQGKLRYLLARRLARMGQFEEAEDYLPADLRSVLERYRECLRRGRNSKLDWKKRAENLWQAAQIYRHWGMELFGFEGAPDFRVWDGQHDWGDLPTLRQDGVAKAWKAEGAVTMEVQFTVPPPASEKKRTQKHQLAQESRYHYRYLAGKLCLEAARLVPDTHAQEAIALILIGGKWAESSVQSLGREFDVEYSRRFPNGSAQFIYSSSAQGHIVSELPR